MAQDGSLELLRLLADSAPTHHLDRIGAQPEACLLYTSDAADE